jgi:hypothetical protein
MNFMPWHYHARDPSELAALEQETYQGGRTADVHHSALCCTADDKVKNEVHKFQSRRVAELAYGDCSYSS